MILLVELLFLLTLSVWTDGYNWYRVRDCIRSSPDLTDLEFIDTYYFNMDPYIRFNSTVGEFVGYSELGVQTAEMWNKGPEVQQERGERDRYCRSIAASEYSHILDKAVKPEIRLGSEEHPSDDHQAILTCSAYGFYPPVINVSWLKNGIKVTTEVISTEEMANGDWYYQIHSYLEYTPKFGEKISCVVEHVSYAEPMIYDWIPSFPDTDKIIIGASGMGVGVILAIAGYIYYKMKPSELL